MMEYNDENLLLLWADGLSHSHIAAQLGVTKGVAAGRLRRLRAAKDKGVLLGKYKALKEENDKARQAKPPAKKFKPKKVVRKGSFVFRAPRKHFTKPELYEMLAEAVRNTK